MKTRLNEWKPEFKNLINKQDISLPANRENIVERIMKARSLYPNVTVLVQDDRESNLVKFVLNIF